MSSSSVGTKDFSHIDSKGILWFVELIWGHRWIVDACAGKVSKEGATSPKNGLSSSTLPGSAEIKHNTLITNNKGLSLVYNELRQQN